MVTLIEILVVDCSLEGKASDSIMQQIKKPHRLQDIKLQIKDRDGDEYKFP